MLTPVLPRRSPVLFRALSSALPRALLSAALVCWLGVFSQAKAEPPATLVLGGDVAEIVAALGAEASIIARDDTVSYPPALADLPSVGYLRRLSAESVLGLGAQRIIAAHAAGPEQALAQLDASGVELIRVPGEKGLAGIAHKVDAIATALSREEQGQQLTQQLDKDLEQLAALPPLSGLKVMFLLHHGGMTPMVGGHDTLAQTLIEALGATNAFAAMSGYKPVSAEGIIPAAPDVVIVPQAGLDALGGDEGLWQLPGLAQTPAGRQHHLVAIDSSALLSMGPRTPAALVQLHGALESLTPDHQP
ncbi:ABC transporter substrate-binding protein [Halomonas sp. DP8Y7-1]|uniref:heme/hemin ABC transporter substrate-binding protein n=1 Tax=Halomonas sp. DP8Y7-1 TaxID=2859078 RepID=UPI001C93B8B5|nr:ABC transporter substrate-binding protein [Halomonas sp. DP8Y7-1]MBY6028687.1 ABC transporter substrate-binding protein [Halomonas sp. DP8Y7-1]